LKIDYSDAFNSKGLIFGNLEKAFEYYNKAIKIEGRLNFFYNRVYPYKEFGQLEDSIQSFEICIQKYQQKGYENEELEVYHEQVLVFKRQLKFRSFVVVVYDPIQVKMKYLVKGRFIIKVMLIF